MAIRGGGLLRDDNRVPIPILGPVASPSMITLQTVPVLVTLEPDRIYMLSADRVIRCKIGGADVVVAADDFTYHGDLYYTIWVFRTRAGFNYVSIMKAGGTDSKAAFTELG